VAEACRACGAPDPGEGDRCVECGAPVHEPVESVRFGEVVWRAGDLPAAEMRRRLTRRLRAELALVDRWELLAEQARKPVKAPVPLAAPAPVVVAAPEPERPPRFVVPAFPRPPAPPAGNDTLPSVLLENVGWWIGGFLLVAGTVFLVGTVFFALPAVLRVGVEVVAVAALALGLARGGAALASRGIGVGRGLAAVGLAMSLVGSVVVSVEGATFTGGFAALLAALAAALVMRTARGAGLAPFPALGWGALALLPAVAWTVPALAWPAVLASLAAFAYAVRSTLRERRLELGRPLLGAAALGVLATALAALPTTGSGVGWVIAPFVGALAVWVDAADSRWRGIDAPAFARPLPVVGLALGAGALVGLPLATVGWGTGAFLGGVLGLALVGLLARRHPEAFLPVLTGVGALFVPAALLGALGVTGDGNPAGWFTCSMVAAPVVAWWARGDGVTAQRLRWLLAAVGAVAALPVAFGGGTGVVAGVGWGLVLVALVAVTADAGVAGVALALAAATWVAVAAPFGLGVVALGGAALALAADVVGVGLRRRAGSELHPVARVAAVGEHGASALLGLTGLVVAAGRVDGPTAWLLAAGAATAAVAFATAARRREEALTWVGVVIAGVAASMARPVFGLHADPVYGLLAATAAVGAVGVGAWRLDRRPWLRFGMAVEPDGDAPAGWLATPAWVVGHLLLAALVAAAVIESALGRWLPASVLAAATPALALVATRADRRPPTVGLAAAAVLVGGGVAIVASGATPWAPVVGAAVAVVGAVAATRGNVGVATACGLSVVTTYGVYLATETGDAAATAAMAVAAAVPLVAGSVVGWGPLAWPAAGLVGVAVVAGAAPWAGEDPARWGLVAAATGVLAALVGGAAARAQRVASLAPASLGLGVVAASASSLALLLGWVFVRTPLPEHAAAAVAWAALVVVGAGRPGAGWVVYRFLATAGLAAQALLLAHRVGRLGPDVPELGATVLATAAAAALLVALRPGGAGRALRSGEPPNPVVATGLALTAFGLAPALVASVFPAHPAGVAAAAAWGVVATAAFGLSLPLAVTLFAAATWAEHVGGGVGLAAVAAAAAWCGAAARRFSPAGSTLSALHDQILVPGAAIVGTAAIVAAAVGNGSPAIIVAVLAVGALGPVPDGLRAPIATLAPALVAALAGAPATLSGGLLSGGAAVLAAWSVATGAPWLAVAGVAAVAGIVADPLGPGWLRALHWLALAATLLPRIRREAEAEVALGGVAVATGVAAGVLVVSATGWWAAVPVAVVTTLAWGEAARWLGQPVRLAYAATTLVALAPLAIAPVHRGAAVVSAGLVAGGMALGWWRRPDAISAVGVLVALGLVPVTARLGLALGLGDALFVTLAGAAAVGLAHVAGRSDGPRGESMALAARGAAVGLPGVGLALAGLTGDALFVTPWLAAAATWAVVHARFRDVPSAILTFVAADVAVVALLLRAGEWDPTLYVLPFVASAAILSHHFRERLSSASLDAIRWGAAGVMYATALGRLVVTADNVLPAVLVGLAGLVAGVAMRVRAFVWSAASFLVAVIVLQAARFGIAHQMGLGVVLTMAGVAVLGATVFVTLRRRLAPGPSAAGDEVAALPSPALEPDPDEGERPAPELAVPARGTAPPPSDPPPGT
jgi:hypothetical protein